MLQKPLSRLGYKSDTMTLNPPLLQGLKTSQKWLDLKNWNLIQLLFGVSVHNKDGSQQNKDN